MRLTFIALFFSLLCLAIFPQSQLPAGLTPQQLEQYQRFIQSSQKPQFSEEVPSYQTPEIYQDTARFRFEQEEKREDIKAEVVREEERGFYELVIVNKDTIQKILKAFPKDLTVYGIEFFSKKDGFAISEAPASGEYRLSAGDNLIISVWGSVDYEYNLTVDREGKVFIPKAGTVAVAGNSLESAKEQIKNALSRIYTDFSVDVTLGKIRGATVFVVGEARKPGAYNLPGISYVIDALVIAGGPNPSGSYRNIGVYRDGVRIATLDIYDFLLKGKTSGNVQLSNGDVIAIPRAGPMIKVRGKVKKPAIYEIRDGISVKEVIELAGGLLPVAHSKAIMIDRVEKGFHSIITINIEDSISAKTPVYDGDDISVFPGSGFRNNVVFLQGQVSQPGAYGIGDSTRISDLILRGEQLLPNAYLKRADLVRTLDNRLKRIIPVSLDSVLAYPRGEADYLLQSEDLLMIYSIWDVETKDYVAVYGSVKKPGEYELFSGMSVSDLIFEAGGPTRSAYWGEAELARIKPGETAKVIKFKLMEAYLNPGSEHDIPLLPYDVVFIRDVPGWKLHDIITITGEVKFPGKYALQKSYERLSEIINRAGGFTDEAFLNGAVFIRQSLSQTMRERNLQRVIQQTQEAVLDTLGNVVTAPFLFTYTPDQLRRIILDMDKAVVQGRLEEDIIMQAGDSIYIPKLPTGVSVVGMVASTGTIHWLPGKNIRYYIDRAGGLTRNADEDGIRLVKANGKVVRASMRTKGVEAGDAIIVPQQIKKRTDWGQILSQTVSIVSGLATTIYILLKI